MSERLYRPGNRPAMRSNARISDNRLTWTVNGQGQFVLMRYENVHEGEVKEAGFTFIVAFNKPGRKPVTINLTALTAEELAYVREFFDLACDLAMPVAAERDRVAEEAKNEGDDSYARIYRPVPKLVKRPGAFGKDGKSVRNGLEHLPGRGGRGADLPDGGVRGVRPDVAAEAPADAGPEDDTPQED